METCSHCGTSGIAVGLERCPHCQATLGQAAPDTRRPGGAGARAGNHAGTAARPEVPAPPGFA